MQIPESWLRSFVNPALNTEQLAHALTMSGAEVEEVSSVAPPFSQVVVAKVISLEKHPNADKLNVCQVDAGTGTTLQIVCGAPNVFAGAVVPCALVGAVLPGDFQIKLSKLRGVESQGMLCSARELGISEENAGLLMLSDALKPGLSIREVLQLDDKVLTLKLTPNKADCLSVFGIAREVAAITGAALTAPQIQPVPVTLNEVRKVHVQATDLCGRFSGRVVRGLNAKAPTPDWMKQRLERAGQRSISALVDISNYVMLELGRPSHVFDLDKVHGDLQVRWGRAGEQVKLLNGNTVAVDDQVGVIADDQGVEALAGIMGGDATAVSLDTHNVYVEAAFWWPEKIQGRSRRYNFSTDAGHRFERGVDPATTVDHIEYITQLLLQVCGTSDTKVGPIDDQQLNIPQRKAVTMRCDRARKVIGVALTDDQMMQTLQRLGLAPSLAAGVVTVVPPSFRFDLQIEEDLIEEVARIYGFENIPTLPPKAPANMRTTPENQRSRHTLRALLASCDYTEAVNYSFVDGTWEQDFCAGTTPVALLNPMSQQMNVMRTSLIGGLMQNLRYNLSRQHSRVRMFELGKVFLRNTQADGPLQVAQIEQPVRIAGIAYGPAAPDQWGQAAQWVDFYDVKADVETLLAPFNARFEPFAQGQEHPALHPGRSACILMQDKQIGVIGQLHPKWLQKYGLDKPAIVFELEADACLQRPMPQPTDVPKVPGVQRDFAVVVAESVAVQQLLDIMTSAIAQKGEMQVVRNIKLFDEFRGKPLDNKEKSLAFRVWMQDTSSTLSDAQVDAAVQTLLQALGEQANAKLRA